MLEAITLMQSGEWLHSQLLKAPHVRRSVEVPSIEPAKDGFVGISMVTGQQWLDFAAMVDCPEFTEVPQLQFQIGRWDYRDWIRERIDPWMRERTVEEIVELGTAVQVAAGRAGKRRHDPRDGSPAGARACTWTTRPGSGNRVRRG